MIPSRILTRYEIKWWHIVVLFLVFACLLRVAVAAVRSPDLTYDEPTFFDLSTSLISGHGLAFPGDYYGVAIGGQPTAFEEPLYPLWLAFLRLVTGSSDIRVLRVIQAGLGSVIVLVAFCLASQVFDRRAGLVAAGAVAFWPPLVFFSTFLMQEALYIILLPLALWMTLIIAKRRAAHPALMLSTGILWGMTILDRGATAGLLVLVLGWLFLTLTGVRRIAVPSAVALTVVLVLLPWWVRNYSVFHTFVPLTTKAGYNLYHWDYPIDDPTMNDFGVNAPPVSGATEVARDHAYQQMAIQAMLAHRKSVLEDAFWKGIKFFRPAIGEEGPGALSLPYGLLLSIVYAGALIQFLRDFRIPFRSHTFLLWLAVAFELIVAMVAFSNNRARLPAEMLLLLLAVPSFIGLLHVIHWPAMGAAKRGT